MKINNRAIKRIIALLFSGWCIIWIYRTMIGAVHSEIMEVVGQQSAAGLGLISSCYFAGYVLMQIPGGFIMDRFGKRKVLLPSFLMLAAGFVAIGYARSINGIYIGSVIAGIGSGTYYSGAFSLSTQNVPKQYKYFATAIINSGCAFGMLLGYIYTSGAVKQLGADWRWMIFLLAVAAAAMIPLMNKLLKDEGIEDRPAREEDAVKSAGGVRAVAREMLAPRLLASYFLYFSTCYGYYMIVSWLPAFLQNERGFSGVLAGYASSVIALVSIPGALFLGKAVDRFSRHRMALLSGLQLMSALMLVCVTAFENHALIVISLAIYGVCGKQGIDPMIVPHVSEQFRSRALSTGLGVFNFFGMSASVIAPLATGMVKDTSGSQVAGFYAAAALLALSAALFGIVNGKEKKIRTEE